MPEGPNPTSNERPTEPNPRFELYIPPSVIEDYKTEQAKSSGFERWRFTVEILTLAAIVAYSVIAYFQWQSMRTATEASRQSADAATKAANTAEKTFLDGQQSSRDTLTEMQRQSEAMQNAAKAATEQTAVSRDALSVSRETAYSDQRPWVTIRGYLLPEEPMNRDSIRINGYYLNTGNSPGTRVHVQSAVIISAVQPSVRFPLPKTISSATLLPPDSAPIEKPRFTIEAEGITAEQIGAYNSRQAIMWIHAIVRYQDVFGVPHWTTSCVFRWHGESLTLFNFCADGNNMDANTKKDDPPGPP